MFIDLIQFFISSAVIVVAGLFLTRAADKIAEVTGWGRLFVGGLFLAGATSLPELMVDIKSVQLGLPDLAVGDLLGSSMFNLLILASLDFFFPSTFQRTAFSPQFLHHSLAATLTVVLTALVGVGIASGLEVSFAGIGVFEWLVVLVYLYGLRLIFLEQTGSYKMSFVSGKQGSFSWSSPILIRALLLYFVCTAVILSAAPFLVESADQIAKLSGLGHSFIGTTLVALATSLPELVATLVAFRIGAPDLALGNIFGSNAFNMVLFWPLDLIFPGVLFSSVNKVHAVTALGVITATGIAIMGQLYRKKERARFAEPSSELVVLVILLFLYLLFVLKGGS